MQASQKPPSILTGVEHGPGLGEGIVGHVLLPLLAVREPRRGEGVDEVEEERLVVARLAVAALLQRKGELGPPLSARSTAAAAMNNANNPMRHLKIFREKKEGRKGATN